MHVKLGLDPFQGNKPTTEERYVGFSFPASHTIKVFAPLLKIKENYILLLGGCIQGGLNDFFGNSLICKDMRIDDERFCSGFQLT